MSRLGALGASCARLSRQNSSSRLVLSHGGFLQYGNSFARPFILCRGEFPACDSMFDAMLGAMSMFDLRQLRRFRRAGRLLAVCLAYALAVQAVVASVGTGMSAFAAPGQAGFVICGQVSAPGPGDRNPPSSVPQCPFCFVAAQTAGHFALAGAAPATPTYTVLAFALVADLISRPAVVPRFHRTVGDPRAPPAFSA